MGQPAKGSEPHPSARERLVAALEASCAALIELQLIRAVGGDDVNAHADLAIDAVRRVIVEVRAARGERRSALAAGFVTGKLVEGSGEP